MFGSFYGAAGLLTLAAQVFLAVHCLRSGRPWWWLMLIFFFPPVGPLVYFFVEFLPSMRAGGRVRAVTKDVARLINPTAEIRRLEDVLSLTPTVNNRMELARAYLRVGRNEDAIAAYRACAQGIHADDPRLLYEMSQAYYHNGDLAEARESFERLRKQTVLTPEQQLLSARIYEDADDTEGALREYAALSGRGTGEEARCRYALLLQRLGRNDEAQTIFDQIVRHARLSSSHYRREEKEWIDVAKRELKSAEAAK